MTQGIYLFGSRPKSKKAIKEAIDEAYSQSPENPDLYSVVIEATSIFGNEYDGSLAMAPKNETYTFVGPDPRTSRKFYGNLVFDTKKNRWVVK
jgi:hypothetical protein